MVRISRLNVTAAQLQLDVLRDNVDRELDEEQEERRDPVYDPSGCASVQTLIWSQVPLRYFA